MKVETVNGVLTAKAETKEDIQTLLSYDEVKSTSRKPRKYKRQVLKQCPHCPNSFRGNVGLGIHMRKIHGIRSNQAPQQNKPEVSTLPIGGRVPVTA